MKLFGIDFGNLSYSPTENYKNNKSFMESLDFSKPVLGFSSDGYIENQHRLEGMKYSARNFSYCGCGCIAYYNILKHRGFSPNLPKLSSEMEKGCVLRGVFGTNAFFMKKFMKKKGENVKVFFSEKKLLNSNVNEGIIFYYRWPKVGHYVAFTLEGENGNNEKLFRFYNAGGKTQKRLKGGAPAIMTLSEYIKETAWTFSAFYKLG